MSGAPESDRVEVTVVIPNYNGDRYIRDCVAALGRQSIRVDLIVVDNGSTDASLGWLRQQAKGNGGGSFPGIRSFRLMELDTNTGFAHAVNVGIEAAETPYVLLLNDDTVPRPDMAGRLLMHIRSTPRTFSVGAKLLSMREGNPIDDCGDLFCALGWAFSPGRDADRRWYNRACDVTTACAGAAIYDRERVLGLGGFDDAHFCYLEDVDIGLRARIRGLRNRYEPRAVCLHAGSATSGSRHNSFKERLTAANTIYLIYKNMPLWQMVLNLPLIVAGIVIKLVYFGRKGLMKDYAAGLLDGVRKCAANPERRVRFGSGDLPALLKLQLEYYVNCIRRIVG